MSSSVSFPDSVHDLSASERLSSGVTPDQDPSIPIFARFNQEAASGTVPQSSCRFLLAKLSLQQACTGSGFELLRFGVSGVRAPWIRPLRAARKTFCVVGGILYAAGSRIVLRIPFSEKCQKRRITWLSSCASVRGLKTICPVRDCQSRCSAC